MGAFLSSSGKAKDSASALSKASKNVRQLLGCLVVPSLVLIVFFGVVLLIVGIAVGVLSHWSGFLVGGLLFIACLVGAVMFWDLWGTVSVGLSMFELASCPREELVQKLQQYKQKTGTPEQADESTDIALRKMCEKIADTILSKFTMAFQWGPLLFTALAILACVLSVVIEGAPTGLLVASIVAVVDGMFASFVGIVIMCCVLTPLIESTVKNELDGYVQSLQKKLSEQEGATTSGEP